MKTTLLMILILLASIFSLNINTEAGLTGKDSQTEERPYFNFQPTIMDLQETNNEAQQGQDELIITPQPDESELYMPGINPFPPFMEGWPVNDSHFNSSITAADLDNDGKMELVGTRFSYFSSNIFIKKYDGTDFPGWPKYFTHDYSIEVSYSTPVVFDLDGDGNKEIITAVGDGTIHVFRADGTELPGWPQSVVVNGGGEHPFFLSSPTVADINADNQEEVIIMVDYCGHRNDTRIFIWHPDGTLLDGWPMAGYHCVSWSTIAAADINNDGINEMLFKSQGVGGGLFYDTYLFVLNYLGEHVQGWPYRLGTEMFIEYGQGSVVIGDLENDGQEEIVATSDGWSTRAYVFNADGTLRENWPQSVSGSTSFTPVLADINEDGNLEIIVYAALRTYVEAPPLRDNYLTVFDHNGNELTGWPQILGSAHIGDIDILGPVVGDLDNDGTQEIVAGCVNQGGGKLYILNPDGTMRFSPFRFSGLAQQEGQNNNNQTNSSCLRDSLISPAIADLDGDGAVELIVTNTRNLYVWRFSGDERKQQWSKFQYDDCHTGFVNPPVHTLIKDLSAKAVHSDSSYTTKKGFDIYAGIRNEGEVKLSDVEVNLWIDNNLVLENYVIPGDFEPGQYRDVPIYHWHPPTVGNHNVKIKVDPRNLIDEENETNNEKEATITVLTLDVKVENARILHPPPLRVGQNIAIGYDVKNVGQAATGETTQSKVTVTPLHHPDERMTYVLNIGNIVPGQTWNCTCVFTPQRAEPHVIQIEADSNHQLPEENESNNWATLTANIEP